MTDFELQCLQHYSLALQNLLLRIALVRHEDELFDGRGENLLVLRSDEHRCHADELQLEDGDNPLRQEAIDNVDSDPQRFWKHVISQMHLQ